MKGATALDPYLVQIADISIHAPVKGATVEMEGKQYDELISIHAPVKGATVVEAVQFVDTEISIHAPVKGATGV